MPLPADVRALVNVGEKLFDARPLNLWQALAENFHTARADFLVDRQIDDELDSSMSSIPALMRRELAQSISVNVRPRHLPWFKLYSEVAEQDTDSSRWLEIASEVVRRAIYDPQSGFVRATREADDDWVTFGQCVIWCGVNRDRTRLLYKCYHLRDCTWAEGSNGMVDTVYRKWKPTVRQLCYLFPNKVSENLKKTIKDNPERQVDCLHIAAPRENYIYKSSKTKGGFVSLIVDMENQVVLEETSQETLRYVVPRWATVSGTPFARSPVCDVMLPDARTTQALTRIILEAGEKAVDPSIILSEEVFRSDLDLRPGGITWADLEYDQRLADKYSLLATDKSGLPVALQLSQMLGMALKDGFYVSKLAMPNPDRERVTAYEIRRAMEQHIRDIAPIYEPIEEEYSTRILDETLSIMLRYGAFGPPETIPEAMRGSDVTYTFKSPLREAEKELTAQQFMQGAQLLQMAAQLDPTLLAMPKPKEILREALKGIGWKEEWMNSEEEMQEKAAQFEQMQKVMQEAQAGQAVGEAAKKGGEGMEKIAKGGADLGELLGSVMPPTETPQ